MPARVCRRGAGGRAAAAGAWRQEGGGKVVAARVWRRYGGGKVVAKWSWRGRGDEALAALGSRGVGTLVARWLWACVRLKPDGFSGASLVPVASL